MLLVKATRGAGPRPGKVVTEDGTKADNPSVKWDDRLLLASAAAAAECTDTMSLCDRCAAK